jgi:choline dehydrogenase
MKDHFDYVIVGAGSAGAALAARLTEDPGCRVLLLEAGPTDRKQAIHIPAAFSTLYRTDLDWDYFTEPQPALAGRRIFWPRGKMLGGCSSINAMMWVRGFAADYDEWAEHAGPGWSYESVLNYFRRIEDTEAAAGDHQGRGGPMAVSEQRSPSPLTEAFLQACEQVGVPRTSGAEVNGAQPEGVAQTRVSQRRGRRWSTVDGYLRPAKRRPNLTILTGAHTTKVRLEGTRATGVEYVHSGAVRVARAGSEVILCGGAINTPQLLMLSGIGPAGQLRAHGIEVAQNLPEVGQNLQDHLVSALIAHSSSKDTLYAAQSPRQLVRYLTRQRGMLTSNVAEAYGFVRSDDALPLPDLELIFAPAPFVGEGLAKPTGHGITVGPILVRPRSSGEVTLASADPFSAPRIDPRYLSDPEGADMAAMRSGMELSEQILAAPALSRYVQGYMQPGNEVSAAERTDTAIRRHSHTLYHPVGTCRMGNDDGAVVDPELRVRGIDGLRVADASVMPRIIRGHTNAPSIVIGERAADLLKLGSASPVRGVEPTARA